MEAFDITKYIDTAFRRKYWIIYPFLLVVLAGFTYYLNVKKTYKANTLILVQAQKVPSDFVRTIVSSDIEDRLRTITQQVTSRTNLEQIIKEYNLYIKSDSADLLMEDKVILLRARINIDVARGGGRGGKCFFHLL